MTSIFSSNFEHVVLGKDKVNFMTVFYLNFAVLDNYEQVKLIAAFVFCFYSLLLKYPLKIQPICIPNSYLKDYQLIVNL